MAVIVLRKLGRWLWFAFMIWLAIGLIVAGPWALIMVVAIWFYAKYIYDQ